MKLLRRATSLGFIGLSAAGCAIFPSNAGFANFAAINFTFSVNSQINAGQDGNSPYIYDVAIRPVFKPGSPPDNGVNSLDTPTYAPIPTVDSTNPNGRMNGSPNVFVEFTPGAIPEFILYRFALASEVRPKYDPTNPVNLAVYAVSTRGVVTNTQSPLEGGDAATLSFTIHANELVDKDQDAQYIQYLQVNILTMTRPSSGTGGTRIIDALGPTNAPGGLTNYLNVTMPVSTNNGAGFEPANDTVGGYDPAIDIVNYTISITQP